MSFNHAMETNIPYLFMCECVFVLQRYIKFSNHTITIYVIAYIPSKMVHTVLQCTIYSVRNHTNSINEKSNEIFSEFFPHTLLRREFVTIKLFLSVSQWYQYRKNSWLRVTFSSTLILFFFSCWLLFATSQIIWS